MRQSYSCTQTWHVSPVFVFALSYETALMWTNEQTNALQYLQMNETTVDHASLVSSALALLRLMDHLSDFPEMQQAKRLMMHVLCKSLSYFAFLYFLYINYLDRPINLVYSVYLL